MPAGPVNFAPAVGCAAASDTDCMVDRIAIGLNGRIEPQRPEEIELPFRLIDSEVRLIP